MRRLASLCLALAVPLAACGNCDDNCVEFIELSFVSSMPSGEFASTAYSVTLSADGDVATCEIEVAATGELPVACQGNAEISVTTAVEGGDSTGGGSPDGPPRIVVHWESAPATFDFVVRDAASTLVLSNTLSPAYNEQDERACDGECRRFDQEVVLAG
jgi:hypothetical protein